MLTLNFYQEEVEFPLAFYTAIFQDSFSQEIADFDTISEEFLATFEGLEYFRWEFEAIIDGKSVHHIFCFFRIRRLEVNHRLYSTSQFGRGI